ncbi:hypothetical protein GALMADRAFT_146789 [Galerina marginata CBS 339.88]|uniref:Uncharacterized protein n=1 Tax=Galerina marginata (strain CBS 339.88) TaxID=685588 RepID=A0A067SCQ1_GALM3|nr:hypothetical protein GALMADRAFT_146789 [Galerina marginata CBS 339.88]
MDRLSDDSPQPPVSFPPGLAYRSAYQHPLHPPTPSGGYYHPYYTPPPLYPVESSTEAQSGIHGPPLQFHHTFATTKLVVYAFAPWTIPVELLIGSSISAESSSRKRAAPNNSTSITASKRVRRSNTENAGLAAPAPTHPQHGDLPTAHSAPTSQSSAPQPQPAGTNRVPGVGPFTAPVNLSNIQLPGLSGVGLGSILPQEKRSTSKAADVWFFDKRAVCKDRPASADPPLSSDSDLLSERPKDAEFVACRLCSGKDWTVWKCCEGQTTSIRNHLQEKDVYREMVIADWWLPLLSINLDSSLEAHIYNA